jgi:hypothetical protein
MKNLILFLAAIWFVMSCSSTRNVTTTNSSPGIVSNQGERDGSSFEKAILITEKSETKGVSAEYAWLQEHYPGYKSKGQVLSQHDDKPYDIIKIVTQQGVEKNIYFDISNFYGKF